MIRRAAMAGSVFTLVGVVVAVMMLPALGADLHEPHVGTVCDGTGTWHFVHNQVPEGSGDGVLTAEFSSGTFVVGAYKILNSVRHYEVVAAGTLLGASDDIDGGKLVLSDVSCEPDGTTTTLDTAPTTKVTTTTKPTTTTKVTTTTKPTTTSQATTTTTKREPPKTEPTTTSKVTTTTKPEPPDTRPPRPPRTRPTSTTEPPKTEPTKTDATQAADPVGKTWVVPDWK